eukprot:4090733-Prymnesium_polylepis.1
MRSRSSSSIATKQMPRRLMQKSQGHMSCLCTSWHTTPTGARRARRWASRRPQRPYPRPS